MVSADEIERFLADFNPAGKLNPEEVFLFGNPQSEVSAVRGIGNMRLLDGNYRSRFTRSPASMQSDSLP